MMRWLALAAWCVVGSARERRELKSVTVKVLTQKRERSLRRLLASLEGASYPEGVSVDVEIYVDQVAATTSWLVAPDVRVARRQRRSTVRAAREWVASGAWQWGAVSVHRAPSQRGLRGQWLACSDPSIFGEEMGRVIILEDDVELSPAWFEYLAQAHRVYGSAPNVAGISLQRQKSRLDFYASELGLEDKTSKNGRAKGKPSKLAPLLAEIELDSNYLFPHVGSWGFSPEPRVWYAFRRWMTQLKDADHHSAWSVGVDGEAWSASPRESVFKESLVSRWYRQSLETTRGERGMVPQGSGSADSMWTAHFDAFCAQRGLYTVHPHVFEQDQDGALRPAALAASWRDAGEHYAIGKLDTRLLSFGGWAGRYRDAKSEGYSSLLGGADRLQPQIVSLGGAVLKAAEIRRAKDLFLGAYLGVHAERRRRLLELDSEWELTEAMATDDVPAAVQGNVWGYAPLTTISHDEALCILDGKNVMVMGDSISRYFYFVLNYFLKFGTISPEFDRTDGQVGWGYAETWQDTKNGVTDYYDAGNTWTDDAYRTSNNQHRQMFTATFDGPTGDVGTGFRFIQDSWYPALATLAETVRDDYDVLIINSGFWELKGNDDDHSSDTCSITESNSDYDESTTVNVFYEEQACMDSYASDLYDEDTEDSLHHGLLRYYAGVDKAVVWRSSSCCGVGYNGVDQDLSEGSIAVHAMNVVAERIMYTNGIEVLDVEPMISTVNVGYGDEIVDEAADFGSNPASRTFDGLHPRSAQLFLWVQLTLNKVAAQLDRTEQCLASPSAAPSPRPSTATPSATPVAAPTAAETFSPTFAPSEVPSAQPSAFPTTHPTTSAPSAAPSTLQPTSRTPTAQPTSAAPTTATCANGVADGDESDVDCGGSCSGCAVSLACFVATDCASQACSDLFCVLAPTATPTSAPSAAPSPRPTDSPTSMPVNTRAPTKSPTTHAPTAPPTSAPSLSPTSMPSKTPTAPSPLPSGAPVPQPSSSTPTLRPTPRPSNAPQPWPTKAPVVAYVAPDDDSGYGNTDNVNDFASTQTLTIGNTTIEFVCFSANDGIKYKNSQALNLAYCPKTGQKLLLALLVATVLSTILALAKKCREKPQKMGDTGYRVFEQSKASNAGAVVRPPPNPLAGGNDRLEDELSNSANEVLRQMEAVEVKNNNKVLPSVAEDEEDVEEGGDTFASETRPAADSRAQSYRTNSRQGSSFKGSGYQRNSSMQRGMSRKGSSLRVDGSTHNPRTSVSLVNQKFSFASQPRQSSYAEPHLTRSSSVAFSFYDGGDSSDEEEEELLEKSEGADAVAAVAALAPKPKPKGMTLAACFTALELAVLLALCVVGEHRMPSGVLPAGTQTLTENIDLWTFIMVLMVVMGLLNVEVLEEDSAVFLSRAQANEWKGWMQVAFVAYHYTNANDVYVPIRWAVSAYVWLTGFGNGVYFWTTADYSLKRFAQQIWRMNFLCMLLSLATGTPWIEYYFVALATVHFTLIFIALGIARFVGTNVGWPEPNVRKTGLEACYPEKLLGLLVMTGICCAIWLGGRSDDSGAFEGSPTTVYDILFRWWLRDISPYAEWYFWLRTRMDFLSSIPGLMLAAVYTRFRDRWPFVQEGQAWYTSWERVAMNAVALAMLALGAGVAMQKEYCCNSGAEYRDINPYIGTLWIPAYLLFRNATPWFARRVAKPVEWIGMHSLEFYLLQYHVFLTDRSQRILYIIPHEEWSSTNMILTCGVYVYVVVKALEVSNVMRTIAWRANRWKVLPSIAWVVATYATLADGHYEHSCSNLPWAIWFVWTCVASAFFLYWTATS